MFRLGMIANLVAYSVVVSQPLAYLFFIGKAQRALSAPAYIELRQRINPVMTRRLPVVYLSTLAITLVLLTLSVWIQNWRVVVATTIAVLCLLIDIFLMVRENVPINGVVDRWSITDYPEDWEDYRRRWFSIFGYRQVVLLVGFFSLLDGAVFQS